MRFKKCSVLISFFIVLFVMTIGLYGQEESQGVNEDFVLAIMSLFGIGVIGATEIVKRLFKIENLADKLKDIMGYVISFIVSGACTAVYFLKESMFNWTAFILYTIYVFAFANGLWKAGKKITE